MPHSPWRHPVMRMHCQRSMWPPSLELLSYREAEGTVLCTQPLMLSKGVCKAFSWLLYRKRMRLGGLRRCPTRNRSTQAVASCVSVASSSRADMACSSRRGSQLPRQICNISTWPAQKIFCNKFALKQGNCTEPGAVCAPSAASLPGLPCQSSGTTAQRLPSCNQSGVQKSFLIWCMHPDCHQPRTWM